MANNIRRLVSIMWLWGLCVGQIVVEPPTEIEGLNVTALECGKHDPTNKAIVKLEIDCDEKISTIRNDITALRGSIKRDCDENMSAIRNDINALRESIKKEISSITQSTNVFQCCHLQHQRVTQ
ncbi:uncharacterized protein LOC135212298 [Macrobrachium nipponense]|uniref:uncharacterized protein LOC135212298 n=1 Tax=Macrobrachium nipponense TaxID=159736 RepID=UPI0030C8A6CC